MWILKGVCSTVTVWPAGMVWVATHVKSIIRVTYLTRMLVGYGIWWPVCVLGALFLAYKCGYENSRWSKPLNGNSLFESTCCKHILSSTICNAIVECYHIYNFYNTVTMAVFHLDFLCFKFLDVRQVMACHLWLVFRDSLHFWMSPLPTVQTPWISTSLLRMDSKIVLSLQISSFTPTWSFWVSMPLNPYT